MPVAFYLRRLHHCDPLCAPLRGVSGTVFCAEILQQNDCPSADDSIPDSSESLWDSCAYNTDLCGLSDEQLALSSGAALAVDRYNA